MIPKPVYTPLITSDDSYPTRVATRVQGRCRNGASPDHLELPR